MIQLETRNHAFKLICLWIDDNNSHFKDANITFGIAEETEGCECGQTSLLTATIDGHDETAMVSYCPVCGNDTLNYPFALETCKNHNSKP